MRAHRRRRPPGLGAVLALIVGRFYTSNPAAEVELHVGVGGVLAETPAVGLADLEAGPLILPCKLLAESHPLGTTVLELDPAVTMQLGLAMKPDGVPEICGYRSASTRRSTPATGMPTQSGRLFNS